ncbi:MAG: hypothetical protein IKU39_02750 [Lachnospiraceae bacterium]|nr:hypothetical protein [Lachnospiraceae bacterium]
MIKKKDFKENFDKKFGRYKSKRIAIYGTGLNARLIAENVFDYSIVGYITKELPCEFIDGKNVILISDAIDLADIIIIAATVQSTKIVYSRIKKYIPDSIIVVDMYGNDLSNSEAIELNPYWHRSYAQLCDEIDKHEVISFDIFDTLIMRRCLRPDDIFNDFDESFSKCRLKKEIELNKKLRAATIDEIYEEVGNELQLEGEEVLNKKDKEYQLNKKLICVRYKMRDALLYARKKGKQIVFTTDMYYDAKTLRGLLAECDVDDYDIIVSCEYRKSKFDGSLYDILLDKACGKLIIHIGDNKIADATKAIEKGIDTFTIKSSYDLLCDSTFALLSDHVKTKNDQKYLGYLISNLLNNPFSLNEEKGKFRIRDERELAIIIYPITKMFLDYIIEHSNEFECLIFPSRDGYFLYQLYMEEKKKRAELPDAVYLYASRMSMSRAAVSDEKNFDVLISKLFADATLNCKEFIKNQFSIELPNEYDCTSQKLISEFGEEQLKNKLKAYLPDVIATLKNDREQYLKYLDKIGIRKYENIGMIDIVSYGTQIYCLSELLGNKVTMISLGTTGVPNEFVQIDKSKSIYGNINAFCNGGVYSKFDFSVLHLLLEMLYASKDGQFNGFDSNGNALFVGQTEYNSVLIENFQQQINSIQENYSLLWKNVGTFSEEFALECIRLLLSKYSVIDEKLKEKFTFSDPYMGKLRLTNLADEL